MEIKFPKTDLERWALEQKRKVEVNGKQIYISPIELQISFKLFLGSEKDIEDAKYLYELFKEKIDRKLLLEFNRKLEIEAAFKRYLE
ncbi:hypothetical protein JW711_02790 [Candidatus Woesearchaeota archaeon]|nr:hypothetical protein [Candidatus Woesearchaeota archaeon]